TKRMSEAGMSDAVNELTAFVVVRAPSHEAAAQMFEGHPHFTIFPCDCVEVMPLLGGRDRRGSGLRGSGAEAPVRNRVCRRPWVPIFFGTSGVGRALFVAR